MRHVAAGRLSPDFWSAPAVAGALARCDFPVLLEEIRRARGWTQAGLADEVGYSQSWVSKVMRGKQVLTIDQAREVSRRLGIPVPTEAPTSTGTKTTKKKHKKVTKNSGATKSPATKTEAETASTPAPSTK